MDTPKTSRRDFCAHAISLVTVSTLIQGCGGGGSPTSPGGGGGGNVPSLPTINGNAAGNSVTITVDGSSPLAAAGSAALVTAGGNSYLVTRTGQDSFNAFTAICTHEQCTV